MNSKELRDILISELKTLRSGTSTTDRAHAVSKLSAQIIYSSRLELENKRLDFEIESQVVEVKTVAMLSM